MRESTRPRLSGSTRTALVVLGLCTGWLVIQNSILAFAMLTKNPSVVARVTMVMMKAAALVAARFWTSPVAAALAAALLMALLLRVRPARTRSEARHG